jgi:hypothetical protein
VKTFLIILGVLLLLPGLCGTFFFALGTWGSFEGSAEARGYALMFALFALPCIQAGCFGLWLLARDSASPALRAVTRAAGGFAALATMVFGVRFSMEISNEASNIGELIGMIAGGLLFASIPFWIGGWRALRLPKELPDLVEKSP